MQTRWRTPASSEKGDMNAMKKALYAHGKRRATAFDWVNNAILLLVAVL